MNESIDIKTIYSDQKARIALTRKSMYWFFHIYFSKHIEFKTADFHREIFGIIEEDTNKLNVFVAFRGSAKSTIASLAYPIWAMVGKHQKKFIILASQVQNQSQLILTNIRNELTTNELLINDFGPFKEISNEWRSNSLVIGPYDTRITSISTGESIRGIRHKEHRPDLIVCDDVEDLESVKTKESRDKTFQWLTGEIIPAGDKKTKVIVIGNLLHQDSLIMKLRKTIEQNEQSGIYRQYPLLDEKGDSLWPDNFDPKRVEELKNSSLDINAYLREYMLYIVPDTGCTIKSEWIHYYDRLPDGKEYFQYIAIGVDPAIGTKESNDYTGMVVAKIYGETRRPLVYILPNPINKKLDFISTIETVKALRSTFREKRYCFYIESVSYQKSLPQYLRHEGFMAYDIPLDGHDKRTRLEFTSHYLQNGFIKFPRQGAEKLIDQLIYFGTMKHDDLADAFSILMLGLMKKPYPVCRAFPFKPEGW